MVYCQCSHVALLVQLCCTFGFPMLDLWFSYAGPLVPECFTLLVPFFLFIYMIASPLAYRLIDSKPKADGT